MHARANMPQTPSLPEPVDMVTQRRDTFVAGACAVLGFLAILVAHGGLDNMIAGSVGSVGGGCVAVGLAYLDRRLSYAQRVQASLPIVLMLGVAGFASKSNAFALAGYPLLLLGAAGLLPVVTRWVKMPPADARVSKRPGAARAGVSPALSNS